NNASCETAKKVSLQITEIKNEGVCHSTGVYYLALNNAVRTQVKR
ncbi:MAG: hypothetical protein ACI974_001729, partial [Paraglaciecola sp.]